MEIFVHAELNYTILKVTRSVVWKLTGGQNQMIITTYGLCLLFLMNDNGDQIPRAINFLTSFDRKLRYRFNPLNQHYTSSASD